MKEIKTKLNNNNMKSLIKWYTLSFVLFTMFFISCTFDNNKVPELSFETHKFSDKVYLFGNENYPSCTIDFSIMIPKDTSYYKNLRKDMMQTYFDSLYNSNSNIDELLYNNAQPFISEFKEQEDLVLEDTANLRASLSWQIIMQNDVVYQDQHFVSFMKELYTYNGGAHGNTNRYYYVYHLDDKKLMSAEDVFVAGKCNELIDLQKKTINQMTEDTSAYWLNGLKCDSNFYLVKNGFVFHYDQYEIASYAAGPMDIFISFDEIEPLLQHPDQFICLKKK